MKKLLLTIAALLPLLPAAAQQAAPTLPFAHPAWVLQGNIYEVNVRQYTPEGTLNAFAKHLDRLQKMGVQTLWFMPLNPISQVGRKGSLGSYYAVADYQKLNPEFGTMADWQRLVQAIHARGMKVIIDWVPNHTGADSPWLTRHPSFFVQDKNGQPAVPFNWDDTRQLNYQNPEMQDSMIAAMRYWVKTSDIDGFRCDVAWNVPGAFWRRAIPALRQSKPLFMLAEGDSAYLPRSGFDAVYPWHMFHAMEKLAAGKRPATVLDSVWAEQQRKYPRGTMELYFTSNHDENSSSNADYGAFPGPEHAPFAVFTQTMGDALPLVYSGQEEPVLRSLKFFDKDPITFGKYGRAKFYKTLLELRQRNPALASDASFQKVTVGDERAVYAYVREKAGKKVLVILNFSNKPQTITVREKALLGRPYNLFMYTTEPLSSKPWQMEPWGYAVYEYGR
ncbi:MAG: alpha-amylase family glycosyl hydrolase [Janthinobacterium lividum]